MKNLKNGITFLALAFLLQIPHISLRLLHVISFIQDRDWIANTVAILSIIGLVFYITGILCLIRFLLWMMKNTAESDN